MVSVASDVYSLGAILYACLSGRAPFLAESSIETLRQVINDDPVPLRVLNARVPKDLENICIKCLAKEPHLRYGTAEALADDLTRYIDGRPVLARPVSATTKFYRWANRNPEISSLIAVVILLLVSGTAVSSYFAVEAEQRATAEKAAREYAEEQEQKVEAALEDTREALVRAEQAETQASTERMSAITAQKTAERERERAEGEKKKAQWQTYVARLQPMRQAWLEKEFGHLERLLSQSTPGKGEPDFRGWEWYYFQDQVSQASERIGEWSNFSGFFTYDADHDRVLIGKLNDEWELWSLQSGMLVDKYHLKRREAMSSVRFSPDGEFVAWGTFDLRLLVMHLKSHRIVHEIDAFPEEQEFQVSDGLKNRVMAIAWHPTGKRLAASTVLGGIKIWDSDSGRLVHELQRSSYASSGESWVTLSLDWHEDSGIAAANRGGIVRTFDPESGEQLWSRDSRGMWPSVVEWNDSGTRLLHGGNGIVVYDREGGELASLPSFSNYARATWINDQEIVFGGSNQDMRVFNVVDKEESNEFHVHQGRVETIVSVDRNTILSGSADGTLRRIRLNDSENIALRIDAHASGEVYGLSWRGDGKVIGTAGMGDNTPRVWDADTGALIAELEGDVGHGTDIEWNEEGSKLVTLHQCDVRFWDPNTYELRGIRSIPGASNANWYREIEWRSEDQQFTIAGTHRVSLFDSESLEFRFHLSGSGAHAWYSYSPDNARICAVSRNKLFVADAHSGESLFETWKPFQISEGYGVDWSPGGSVIAAGGSDVLLYNGSTYELIAILSGHRSEVFCVKYDPTGRRIASVGGDGTLNLWDAATGDLLVRIPHEGEEGLEHLEWSPDGRRIAVTTKTGKLWVWGSPEMPPFPAEIDSIDGTVLQAARTPEEQLAALERQLLLDPENQKLNVEMIHLAERSGRWEVALHLIDAYLERWQGDTWRPSRGLQLAGWLGKQESVAHYSRRCLKALNSSDKSAQAHAALSFLLVPDHAEDIDKLLRITSEFANEEPGGWYYLMPHLVALHCAGHHGELQDRLRPYREADSPVEVRVFLSLFDAAAAVRDGRKQAAAQFLREAEQLLAATFVEHHARNKLAALLLHRDIIKNVEEAKSDYEDQE